MAVQSTKNLPVQLRSHHQVTKQQVIARCLEEEFGAAKSNPLKHQIVREWEVVSPEIININGENVVIGGQKVKQYIGVRLDNNEGQRAGAQSDVLLARCRDDFKALGLPHEEIDDENPLGLAPFKGNYADIMLDSDEYTFKESLTPEQKALGKKPEDAPDKIDPATGKPQVGFRLKFHYLLGKANWGGPKF